jgi:hypothetical protein
MTRTIEDLLAASMREEVVGLTPAPDLVARAAKRHRRRTRIRLAPSVTGTAGIAVVMWERVVAVVGHHLDDDLGAWAPAAGVLLRRAAGRPRRRQSAGGSR